VWRAGLSEHVAVVAERRGLRAALVLEVLEPLCCNFSEGHAAFSALTLARLDRALLSVVLGNHFRHAHRRSLLVEVTILLAPTPLNPTTVIGCAL
jgi:hypothetical protein